MSVEMLELPADRAALMDAAFKEWTIAESRERINVEGWLHSGVKVQISGLKAEGFAVLWGLLRSLG